MIKYLGSKRTLVPVIGDLADAVEARTTVDLFTGTTRVAQELKRRGLLVTAVDLASYSAVLARCYVATDANTVDHAKLDEALATLTALPPVRGYVTRTFCERARYFQPHNGMRIDAISAGLAAYEGSGLYAVLLTALLEAADRVDSTTGLQMAYLKQWAPRSYAVLDLRRPALLPGPGRAIHGDATAVAPGLQRVDLAYLDPPYNQHRYFTNYHVWETIVRGDEPEHYGIACKRVDSRDPSTRSRFNSKRLMPAALAETIHRTRAEVVVVSHNDESWVGVNDIAGWLHEAGHQEVGILAFDRKRYVGAQIGVFNAAGQRVGQVGRTRNIEYLMVAGDRDRVEAALAAGRRHDAGVGRPLSRTAPRG